MNTKTISLIGAGHLGSALIRGLIKQGYPAQSITVSNRNSDKLVQLVAELGVLAAMTNATAAEQSEIIILAVKPQFMQDVCLEIAPIVQKNRPLIISLAAVTQLDTIALWLGLNDLKVMRAMCNTPMEYCKGISALYANAYLTSEDKLSIESIFNAVGSSFWADNESLLIPLTAAIGSAPAYVLLFMEALQKAAMSVEIPEKLAKKIAIDVIAGTAILAEQSDRSFADLRAGVTTPQGVTDHSLKELSVENFFETFKKIYQAANERIEQIKAKDD